MSAGLACALASGPARAEMLQAVAEPERFVGIVAWPGYFERGETDAAFVPILVAYCMCRLARSARPIQYSGRPTQGAGVARVLRTLALRAPTTVRFRGGRVERWDSFHPTRGTKTVAGGDKQRRLVARPDRYWPEGYWNSTSRPVAPRSGELMVQPSRARSKGQAETTQITSISASSST